MASGLRARLRAMDSRTGSSEHNGSTGGLFFHMGRYDPEPGLTSLSAVGLRRIGWSGGRFDVSRCLFLDTETTGLSHGAGTVAFLVGAGFLKDGCFTVEQYLMRDYSQEPELLNRLADRMEDFDYVCTFNGKTFDMPLLETRFTMCRMRHRWRGWENLDLLPPARRTWKLRLGSCRLARLEEMILNQSRGDDLPGSEVPKRYFAYLKSGDSSLLEGILRHNRQDIVTLQTLLVRLCALYDAPENLREKQDLFSVGKTLERQGELKPARMLYRMAAVPAPAGTLTALKGDRIAGMANWRIYLMYRRTGNVEGMRAVLEQMRIRKQMPCEVLTELSKFYEHRCKDLARALEYAREARSLCSDEAVTALNRRIERLQNKLGK